ncbi:MAG: redoxin domain-containing protein [Dehalococcoidia bacterium]|nr:redoxin domain-containing protein [Dehalococcoidia bacterium]
MSTKRTVQLTALVVVIVVAIMVLSQYPLGSVLSLPGCTPSSATGITFIIALDRDQAVKAAYNIGPIPATLLIDREGVVRGRKVGALLSKDAMTGWLDDVTSGPATTPLPGVAPEIGHMAPDFTLPTLDGGTVTLSQLRQQWVLLSFWTTRCTWCVRQMPYLQAAFEERGDEIQFIAINLGESEARVRGFLGG